MICYETVNFGVCRLSVRWEWLLHWDTVHGLAGAGGEKAVQGRALSVRAESSGASSPPSPALDGPRLPSPHPHLLLLIFSGTAWTNPKSQVQAFVLKKRQIKLVFATSLLQDFLCYHVYLKAFWIGLQIWVCS